MFKKMLTLIFITTLTLTLFQSCGSTDSPPINLPDTTTQNFTFETVEFGDGLSSSYLNDVWVFDENNIWAVGYISPSDTTVDGVRIINPNIIKWDGTDWILQPFSGTSSGIYGIWANKTDEIYFANGIVVKYKNENYEYENFQSVPLTNSQAVHKLWGSRESNIWGVGPWGTIVHNNGTGWAKIDFDRQWYFYNITGSKETGIAYAVARSSGDVCIIAELKKNQASIIYNSSENSPKLKSWTIDYHRQKLYLAGADIISVKIWEYDLTSGVKVLIDLEGNPIEADISQITVNNANDIYFIGRSFQIGAMIHYNGNRYSGFRNDLSPLINYGDTHSIDNLCVSVGGFNNKAYLTKIKRN